MIFDALDTQERIAASLEGLQYLANIDSPRIAASPKKSVFRGAGDEENKQDAFSTTYVSFFTTIPTWLFRQLQASAKKHGVTVNHAIEVLIQSGLFMKDEGGEEPQEDEAKHA